jgi:hypothetical protein
MYTYPLINKYFSLIHNFFLKIEDVIQNVKWNNFLCFSCTFFLGSIFLPLTFMYNILSKSPFVEYNQYFSKKKHVMGTSNEFSRM